MAVAETAVTLLVSVCVKICSTLPQENINEINDFYRYNNINREMVLSPYSLTNSTNRPYSGSYLNDWDNFYKDTYGIPQDQDIIYMQEHLIGFDGFAAPAIDAAVAKIKPNDLLDSMKTVIHEQGHLDGYAHEEEDRMNMMHPYSCPDATVLLECEIREDQKYLEDQYIHDEEYMISIIHTLPRKKKEKILEETRYDKRKTWHSHSRLQH